MKNIKSLEIGRLTLKNNVFVAPLAGFSDYAFRAVCYELGTSLAFGEMVSAKGLKYKNIATCELLRTTSFEYVKAAQIFGNDPLIMREAVESKELEKFDIIDINFGCPVPKVFNNGEGSALLNEPRLVEKIVSECVKGGKIITAKIRLGVEKGKFVATEIAKVIEGAGAKMVTVHARTREDYYMGEPIYSEVEKVVNSVKIPVIYNGSVFSKEDFDFYLTQTGASGVMLGRGALKTPWLIKEILGENDFDKKEIINRHIDLSLEDNCTVHKIVALRKQMAYYLSNVKNAKALRQKVFSVTTKQELKEIINSIEFLQ